MLEFLSLHCSFAMLSIMQIYIEGFTLHFTILFFPFACGCGEPLVIPGMLQNPLCAVFMIWTVSLLLEIGDGRSSKQLSIFLDPCKSCESISISSIGQASVYPYQPVTHNSECSWMLSESLVFLFLHHICIFNMGGLRDQGCREGFRQLIPLSSLPADRYR